VSIKEAGNEFLKWWPLYVVVITCAFGFGMANSRLDEHEHRLAAQDARLNVFEDINKRLSRIEGKLGIGQ
jgi:hypothetical protein